MTISCPACRAENGERTCRRCKADLGMLFDLEARRGVLLREAALAIERRDGIAALSAAVQARNLRDGADVTQLMACGYLLTRRFDEAYRCWVACFRGSHAELMS